MTEDEWNRQAARLSAAWPSTPMDETRSRVYYDALTDLDGSAIEQAVDRVLREAHESLPARGVLRARATGTTTGEGEPAMRSDQEEREGRRPWLGVLFGILGLFPLALWFGIRSLIDRKRAKTEGRQPPGELWAAITAVILGVIALVLTPIMIAYAFSEGPNGGDYLTRAELEASIVREGEFGGDAEKIRPTSANCVERDTWGGEYRCIVEFRGGFQQTYEVTVAKDGNWVAEPTG